ncbi:hydantoinase/oxoprolinase family protein [Bradyrhizobium erythrophlei]|jgi:N-methylhydantoinase A|uniref:N-methylhydantoinase A n=1 Tax=Bradyrhizobium erythrophlei TaxID=1437360 RepID=A0A1M5JYQ1_9BRAD|nr:hydantoinase/oxoprolinase family protein [Bradyrhizobium erythrophlei]SHG45163.1 N-methylhydantoinase A [Bradyrhizobium erythrophlei]
MSELSAKSEVPAFRIAADIGGTFTDVALLAPNGTLSTAKVPSTPDDYARGVLDGCREILSRDGISPGSLAEVLHASTVATNAILEGKGARTALVTTEGFRDVLEMRRIRVPRLYEPLYRKPAPLVARRFRYEVRERIGPRGEVLVALDEAGLERIAEAIAEAGIEAVAICFLHSYANPAHERRAGQILRQKLPGRFVTLSVDVLPEIREYERTSTTVINAYVAPPVGSYLRSLRKRLDGVGISAPLFMMQSSGGILDLESVLQRPAQVVESGPAAGVIGAGYVGRLAGYANIIALDVGGTTAKASVIENGRHLTTDEYEVGGGISLSSRLVKGGGYALRLPVIDVCEVGTGGGSIIRLNAAGNISIGPQSAGATPGPVCYGRGGNLPTVTDANVVLGYLNPEAIADGVVPIHAAAARDALQRQLADPLCRPVEDIAYGVVGIANALMARAVRSVTTSRGRDPRKFILFAFGGGGGLHAVDLAASLGIGCVVVPPAAGVFSAFGLLFSDIEFTQSQGMLIPLDAAQPARVAAAFETIEQEVLHRLARPPDSIRLRRRVDLRYAGQAFELTVDLPEGLLDADALDRLSDAFDAEHYRTYGHSLPRSHGREIVALRVVGTVIAERPEAKAVADGGGTAANNTATRRAYFGEHGWLETPVVGRGRLARPVLGPLIVEEADSTTIVPPGWLASLDARRNIVIEHQAE